jgi:hypothetical protein
MPQNRNLWLIKPFTAKLNPGNKMVWIVNANGAVVTEITPGTLHGKIDQLATPEETLEIAELITKLLNNEQ